MLFPKKKKDMVDLRELQKRGVVRIPKKEIKIPTTAEGFVELSNSTTKSKTQTSNSSQSNADFFGFANIAEPISKEEQVTTNFNDSSDNYSKREIDTKTTELDNKVYKLEQRIELLERKLNVNQSKDNVGVMGW